ncbi:hypothetical protein ACHHY8_09380 [Enterobacter cloacae complex sp. 2024EL-00215]|uniref:hypothetical protein n=1 Tax=unclassified Enterobacter cloacae complex TaxID=2757714 RepID=UPI0037511226
MKRMFFAQNKKYHADNMVNPGGRIMQTDHNNMILNNKNNKEKENNEAIKNQSILESFVDKTVINKN